MGVTLGLQLHACQRANRPDMASPLVLFHWVTRPAGPAKRPGTMLRGLMDLARGAQTAPVPACSCAKGLAVGVECLQSALRGEGFAAVASLGPSSAAVGRGSQPQATAPISRGGTATAAVGMGTMSGQRGSGDSSSSPSAGSQQRLAAAFHSVDLVHSDLPAHDAHALRNILLRSS
mgnify:CR=1 FL=1